MILSKVLQRGEKGGEKRVHKRKEEEEEVVVLVVVVEEEYSRSLFLLPSLPPCLPVSLPPCLTAPHARRASLLTSRRGHVS
ncbi:hypothetical protein E2C01_028324 [Portunus trituberculatus]|uniref:Uncharacterized protein n=1 Tax=Portunus trituberculatus TaxID=210409 RepID=A0A5B7EK59_PORTR|nr:hypothetical protein [Portunus trituberculatus]